MVAVVEELLQLVPMAQIVVVDLEVQEQQQIFQEVLFQKLVAVEEDQRVIIMDLVVPVAVQLEVLMLVLTQEVAAVEMLAQTKVREKRVDQV
jgi:hypothetical protein